MVSNPTSELEVKMSCEKQLGLWG